MFTILSWVEKINNAPQNIFHQLNSNMNFDKTSSARIH